MCIMRWTDSYSKQKQQQHSHCVLRVYKKVRLILGKSCSHSRKSSEMYEIKWVLDVISNTISFSFLKMSHDYELNVIILRKRNFWSSFISDLSDIFYTHFFALFFHNFHTVNSKGVRERVLIIIREERQWLGKGPVFVKNTFWGDRAEQPAGQQKMAEKSLTKEEKKILFLWIITFNS